MTPDYQAPPPGARIVCERVVKIYRIGATDVTALAGLDFRVDPGEMVGVIGPSGCGKSSLLNVIGALTTPTSGTVTVDGRDLSTLSGSALDGFRRDRVGFVWQDTARNLIHYLDAIENVALPLRLAGAAGGRSRAMELLDLVGLGDRMLHLPSRLSGGQQQRVAIAVALANRPGLLLADEPTGELDGATAEEIYALLRQVNRDLGVTVVIVSHDPNMGRTVDRVVELRDGQTAMEHRGHLGSDGNRAILLVDTVGRVRLPDRFREELDIGDRVSSEFDGERIVLKPYDNDDLWKRHDDD